jgi:hypothetical protein
MQTVISTGVLTIASHRVHIRDEEADMTYESAYEVVHGGLLHLPGFRGWNFTETEEEEFWEALFRLLREKAKDDVEHAISQATQALHSVAAAEPRYPTDDLMHALGDLHENLTRLAQLVGTFDQTAQEPSA